MPERIMRPTPRIVRGNVLFSCPNCQRGLYRLGTSCEQCGQTTRSMWVAQVLSGDYTGAGCSHHVTAATRELAIRSLATWMIGNLGARPEFHIDTEPRMGAYVKLQYIETGGDDA